MVNKGNRWSASNGEEETEGSSYDLDSLSEQLREYGLSDKEAKVYLQISRFGPSTASEIGRSLGIPRTEVYNVLSGLQSKGIMDSTMDRPAKFSVMPLENALDLLIEAQQNRISAMQKDKKKLLKDWKTIEVPSPPGEKERIQTLKRTEQIYARFSEMVTRAKKQVEIVAFGSDLVRAYNAGVFDNIEELYRNKVRVRLLTDFMSRTTEIASNLKKYAEIQQTETDVSFATHFVVVDDLELLMFTKTPGTSAMARKEATALWTNGETLVRTMKRLFEEMAQIPTIPTRPALEVGDEQRMAKEAQLTFREKVKNDLVLMGLEVRENTRILGTSGTGHEFDLGILREGLKPIVTDFVFDSSEISVIPIIKFFAKRNDVEPFVERSTLVVKPRLTTQARELASAYRIRVVELQP